MIAVSGHHPPFLDLADQLLFLHDPLHPLCPMQSDRDDIGYRSLRVFKMLNDILAEKSTVSS
jgi:hypothetical protein